MNFAGQGLVLVMMVKCGLMNNRLDNEYQGGKFKKDLRMEGTTFEILGK